MTFYDTCINVLSVLLIMTGHILVYCVHRKSCIKCMTYTAMGHQIPASENAVVTSGAEWSNSLGGTRNPVMRSRVMTGVSCTEREGH
jgi:hypothetical protein